MASVIKVGDRVRIHSYSSVWEVTGMRLHDNKADVKCVVGDDTCSVGTSGWDYLKFMTVVEEFAVGDIVTCEASPRRWRITGFRGHKIDVACCSRGARGIVYHSEIKRADLGDVVREALSTGCECGSGSDVRGRIHSEWCRCYDGH